MTQTQSRKKNLFQMNVDLMHGPIFRSLVLFMLPILISNLFQQLYNTVDTMIVGNVLGDTALAAIGSCGAIYELLVGFGLGIGNGVAIVAARAYGAQDEDLLKRTVAGSLVIGLVASLTITTAGFFGLRPLLELLDTPGILWPRFDDPEVGKRLAFTGAIKDDVVDMEELACYLMDYLSRRYAPVLAERYKIEVEPEDSGYDLLEKAGRKRGFLMRGAQVDTQRMARVLLDEFRGGKLGRFTLETVEDAQ